MKNTYEYNACSTFQINKHFDLRNGRLFIDNFNLINMKLQPFFIYLRTSSDINNYLSYVMKYENVLFRSCLNYQ